MPSAFPILELSASKMAPLPETLSTVVIPGRVS